MIDLDALEREYGDWPYGNVPKIRALIAELRACRKVVEWARALSVSESDGEAWELSWQELGRALAKLEALK